MVGMKKANHRRWKIKVAALFVGIAAIYVDHKEGVFYERVIIAVTFVIVLWILEALYVHDRDAENNENSVTKQLEKAHAKLSKQFEHLEIKIKAQTFQLEMAQAINKFRGLIGAVLERVQNELVEVFSVNENGFEIRHHSLALISYAAFWELIVEEQRQRNKDGGEPLHVIAIHRCMVEIWDDESMQTVLIKQKEFCDHGGNMKRILCGQAAQPDDRYKRIGAKLSGNNLEVFYYNLNNRVDEFRFRYGFLLVEQLSAVVIWESNGADRRIKKAIYTPRLKYENVNLVELWNRIRSHCVKIPPP
jgi:hypothetical protein